MEHKPKLIRTAVLAAAAGLTFSITATAAPGVVPNVPESVKTAATTIANDAPMKAMLAELVSPEAQQWRFDTLLELVRIASPSRSEMRRQAEITKRLVEEWGFSPEDIMTNAEGTIKGAGLQIVDGLPVYNVCVRIPGTYGAAPDTVTYKGQLPKVLLEGHIDTVNPPELPPASNPYEPVKLQPVNDPVVSTRDELKALKDEIKFDANGRVVKDEVYKKAYKRYQDFEAAKKAGAYRIYVPGYNDAMINTVSVMQAAKLMKKYGVKPVYDIWVCGTTGEEGKGNLCGMKQLYGYSQDVGKGNNALNFVANFGADSTRPGSGTLNYLGSYRFEVKYVEPAGWKLGDKPAPSALMAMNRAIAQIADLKTPWDDDKAAERTTYTVGVADCTPAKGEGMRSEACTLMVDMRSPTQGPLSAIRSKIEPAFAAAVKAENAAYGVKDGDPKAVKMELVWFGDRPAYQRPNYDDIAVTAWWTANEVVGTDVRKDLPTNASSLNDNVPAAVGVPTVNMNVGTNAGGGGGHTWYEWGIPGDGVAEGKRVLRFILSGLIASGYNTSDGKVVEPGVGPMGNRTTEEMFK